MLEKLVARMEQLKQELEQSAASHNGLVGAMVELQKLYHEAVEAAPAVEKAAEVIEAVVSEE